MSTPTPPNDTNNDPPFLCPYCELPLREVMTSGIGGMLIFWHNIPQCRKVVNIQALTVANPSPRILPPRNIFG